MKIIAAKLSDERNGRQGKPYHELTLYRKSTMGLWAMDTMKVSSKPHELLDGFRFKVYVKPTETASGFWVYTDIAETKLYKAMLAAAQPIIIAFLTDVYIHDRYSAHEETLNANHKPFIYGVCEAGSHWVYNRETLENLERNASYTWFAWSWETETLKEVSFDEALQTLPAA